MLILWRPHRFCLQWHPPDAAEGSATSLNRQPELLPTTFWGTNHHSQAGSLSGSLSAGNPAVHFHVGEGLRVLCALWGRDGGHHVLQAQQHGEKQDQQESQQGQEQPHVHVEAGIFVCCCVYFGSQGWEVDTASQVSAEFEINLSHCSLSQLWSIFQICLQISSLPSTDSQRRSGEDSAQMAWWLQQEMLHPLGVKAAAHTVKQTARDRPLQTILHVAVRMTTSITLVLYTPFWLLFHPKNTLGLLLVGHLPWVVKSFGPSLELSPALVFASVVFAARLSNQLSASCSLPQQVVYPWLS